MHTMAMTIIASAIQRQGNKPSASTDARAPSVRVTEPTPGQPASGQPNRRQGNQRQGNQTAIVSSYLNQSISCSCLVSKPAVFIVFAARQCRRVSMSTECTRRTRSNGGTSGSTRCRQKVLGIGRRNSGDYGRNLGINATDRWQQ